MPSILPSRNASKTVNNFFVVISFIAMPFFINQTNDKEEMCADKLCRLCINSVSTSTSLSHKYLQQLSINLGNLILLFPPEQSNNIQATSYYLRQQQKNDAERFRGIMVLEQHVRAQESLLARKTRCRRARSQVPLLGVSTLPTRPTRKTPQRLAGPIEGPLITSRGERSRHPTTEPPTQFPARHTLRAAGNRRHRESSWMRGYENRILSAIALSREVLDARLLRCGGADVGAHRANGSGVVHQPRAGDNFEQ